MNLGVKDIAIDMGTSNTRVYLKDKGIVLRESTVVGINAITNEIIATGNAANVMLGKTPENILAIKPIRLGVISDFYATKSMMEWCIKSISKKEHLLKVRVAVCLPSCITDVEERAIEEATYAAGAKEVYLLPSIMAAAIGSGIKVEKIQGSMILDIGAGKTEAAVISGGGVVASRTVRVGGEDIDRDIVEYIKEKYDVMIGETTAEEIKNTIGAADASMTEEYMNVKGINMTTGLPDNITITTQDIALASKKVFEEITKCIKRVLERVMPELVSDVLEQGIVVCGGGAYIKNIDRYISQKISIPIYLTENPLDSVIKGLGIMLKNLDSMPKKIKNKRR